MDTPNLAQAVLAEQTHLQILSRPEWIEPTVEYLKHRALLCGACSESRIDRLLVALHEGITNAIVHGNLEIASDLKERDDNSFMEALAARAADPLFHSRTVQIIVDYDGQRCQWTITDQGRGFDVEAVLARADSDEPSFLSSGRGILLMRSFMDEVRYEAGGRKLILVMGRESGSERRAQPRQAVQAPLRVAPIRDDGSIDWEAAHAAVAHNLSQQGIGLLQNRLAQTDRILIGLQAEPTPVYIPAEVRHWRALGGDMVELGCRFSAELAHGQPVATPAEVEEAVGRLLGRARTAPLAADERRSHQRVVFSERVEVHTEAGQLAVGYARDLSKGGIAFLTNSRPPREVILVFAPSDAEQPLRVRTEILRCVEVQEGFFDVGGRFVGLAPATA